ncbi:MAG: protein kinase [Acidobacteriota bacterium]|nr:protein kinase [Acidobacteriota bacterium]
MDPKLFGRYQIIRKLAGGGMGRVFLAYDPVLNRQVGLKLIDAGGDRDSLDVIAAERRGATLQDQLAKREASGRVAQIFDVGERDGYFYIAMEYIEGEDLWELMARGPLQPDRAVSIALDILDVLVKAHTFQTVIEDRAHRGIIHGDIKPRNVRITSAGQVKVLDFGIAKAVSMTRSITFNQFGSIPYSSPERLQTGDMDARSDVWSVAIVLFEMLTGHPYFEAEASSKLEWMIRNYKALQPAIATLPPGLKEILSRALDPDLNRRFASAAGFQQALHDWQGFAQPSSGLSTDPDATRRTAYEDPQDHTRRSTPPAPTPPVAAPLIPKLNRQPRSLIKPLIKTVLIMAAVIFFAVVFTVVYEIRMYNNADALRKKIDSGQLGTDDGAKAYRSLAKQSLFALPLWPARNSLRDRYVAEADRVLADYREASESTPVYSRDWKRAQSSLSSAISIAPEDKAIRGRWKLVDGHLKLRERQPDLKGARSDFEEARSLLPHSPDPHLGLALIYMKDGYLDEAERELNEAERNGFRPGRREQKGLADGYKKRGENWISAAKHAHDLTQMEDDLKHADTDLAHAQTLYNSVAPFMNGIELAEKVSLERDKAAKSLTEAQQAQTPASEAPPVTP